jgi:hypothetical protein
MSWRERAPSAAIAGLALLASASGLGNGFAYDDIPIIVENDRVHQLAHLWRLFGESYWPPALNNALYRPLTMTMFSVEWAIGRGAALPFHVVNVVLYALVSVAVYVLARRMLPVGAAWVAAALFAVHPVHVEVVGNVVGQSELLAALAVVAAAALYIGWRRSGDALTTRQLLAIAGLYLVGLLAKEHAITLLGLLVAAEVTVVEDRRPARERVRALRPVYLALVAVAVGFVYARMRVLGAFVGDSPIVPLQGVTWGTRWWTFLGVVPEWVRLLVWPAHLAAAYGPPENPVYTGFDLILLPGMVLLAALVALGLAVRTRAPVVAFGLAWAAIVLLPVSNLVVPSGVLLAERTLFLPSVGIVLAIGGIAPLLEEMRVRQVASELGLGSLGQITAGGSAWVVVLAVVLGAGVWRSAERQGVWKDGWSFFSAGAADAPGSYFAHHAYAGWLFVNNQVAAGEREEIMAMKLYGDDPRVFAALANEYYKVGQCQRAEPLLTRALALNKWFYPARVQLAACYTKDGDYRAMRSTAIVAVALGQNPKLFRHVMQLADSAERSGGTFHPAVFDVPLASRAP